MNENGGTNEKYSSSTAGKVTGVYLLLHIFATQWLETNLVGINLGGSDSFTFAIIS